MVAEVIVPADGELAVIRALSQPGRFSGVSGAVPNPAPDTFFRIEQVGGFTRNLVTSSCTVVVESFSRDRAEALTRCNLAVAYLQADARAGELGGVTCYGVSAGLPGNLPLLTLPSHFRYSATVSVDLRGSAV